MVDIRIGRKMFGTAEAYVDRAGRIVDMLGAD
jgi:hypothetical protein